MTRNLERFIVELAIRGINKDTDQAAEQDFRVELSMRPHILRQKIFWDQEGKSLMIRVQVESINKNLAAKQMAEELFEVANAVLETVEGLNVKILKTEQMGLDEKF